MSNVYGMVVTCAVSALHNVNRCVPRSHPPKTDGRPNAHGMRVGSAVSVPQDRARTGVLRASVEIGTINVRFWAAGLAPCALLGLARIGVLPSIPS